MKKLKSFYKEYGQYVIEFRAIPYIWDGLRPVERRVLISGYNVAKKMIKSANVVGAAIVLHPHGDSSIYSCLTRLVNAGLFDGQGNWGSNIGTESWPAAAMRYTECKLNENTKKLIFEHIDYVPKEKVEHMVEPTYLPTPIPLCFTIDNPNIGVGFGFQTCIPKYKIKDLFKQLINLLKNKKSTIVPYFPNNTIITKESQVKELLEKGYGYITYQSNYEVIENKRTIIIKGVPVKGFAQLNKVMDKYFQKKIITWEDYSKKNKTEVIISVIKNKKCDFQQLKKDIIKCITNKITYNLLFVDDNKKLQVMPVNTLLLSTFNRYKKDTITHINSDIQKVSDMINELTNIQLLRPHVGDLANKNIHNIIDIVNILHKKVNGVIPMDEIERLMNKYTITKLLTIKLEIDKYKQEKKNLQNTLNTIDSVLLDKMIDFSKLF